MRTAKIVLLTLATLAVGAAVTAGAVVYGGLYNVAATEQHTQAVYSLLEVAMRQSVRLRARDIEPPPLTDASMIRRGAACFQAKCVQCHGAPGVSQGDVGKSMQPLPGPLVDAPQRWRPRELYWLTRHGIKMSGMPAWEFRLADDDLWAVVAFLDKLPQLTPADYAAMTRAFDADGGADVHPKASAARGGAVCGPGADPAPGAPGDVERGERALYQYACNACHAIPGITGSRAHVGPPLDGLARRTFIAGRLANNPDNMVRWLRRTREVDPLTAMPQLGVTERDARDIAAYLATLQ